MRRETCPNCRKVVLFTTSQCPSCGVAKPGEKSHPLIQARSKDAAGTKANVRVGRVCLGFLLLLISILPALQWRAWHNDELRLEWPMRDGSVLSMPAPQRLMNNDFQLAYVRGDTALEFEKLSGPSIYKGAVYWRASGPLVLDFPDQTRRGQARRIEAYVAKQRQIYGYSAAAGTFAGILLILTGFVRRNRVQI
jgi:hypothetical protein